MAIMKTVLWSARILGVLILLITLYFFFGHIFSTHESSRGFQSASEIISFLFFPIITIIGLIIALKWEGLGGLMTIIGIIGFIVLNPVMIINPYIFIPIVPAVLYSIYWLMSKRETKK